MLSRLSSVGLWIFCLEEFVSRIRLSVRVSRSVTSRNEDEPDKRSSSSCVYENALYLQRQKKILK